MIEELLLWVAQLNLERAVTAKNVSNLILLMYCVQYLSNKRAHYLCAFLLCEVGALTGFTDPAYPVEFFAFYTMVYCYLFVICLASKDTLKIIICCVIMILFQTVMIKDAILYPNTNTFVYDNYASIVLFIHGLIFLCGTNFKSSVAFIHNITVRVRNSYIFEFILYNLRYSLSRSYRKWR